jgi:hypothetical protein
MTIPLTYSLLALTREQLAHALRLISCSLWSLPTASFQLRWRRMFYFVAAAAAAGVASAEGLDTKADTSADFLPAVQLAPFVVKGEPLSISIHARSKADRRYAERFAEEVIEVAYETLGGSVGAGLVIMGKEGEPHPVFVFRRFLAIAEAGELDPAVAALAPELVKMMQKWEVGMNPNASDSNDALKLDFDQVVEAIPLPLEGIGSKLYQLAWAANFDDARVEQALRSLTMADLKDDQLSKFAWVFYLPPRSALNRVLKHVLPVVLKKEELSFFKRTALRSALVVFKPAIRTAMEGARKGVLFLTVLRAQSSYSQDDMMALTGAYMKVLMPDFKFNGGKTHQRAIDAIEAQKFANEEYARDPFVSPAPLATFDPATYAAFEGDYADNEKTTHRFRRNGDAFTWQYLDREPKVFCPAGERLFVAERGGMTIEFLLDANGTVTGVEERWVRRRKTVPRASSNNSAKDQSVALPAGTHGA